MLLILKGEQEVLIVSCHFPVELTWTFTQTQPLTLGVYLNYPTHLKLVYVGLQITPFAKKPGRIKTPGRQKAFIIPKMHPEEWTVQPLIRKGL